MASSPAQYEKLLATYHALPTREIELRLASGELTLKAISAAQSVLEARLASGTSEADRVSDLPASVGVSVKRPDLSPFRMIGALLLIALVSGLLAQPFQLGGVFFMVMFFVVLPGVAAIVGKSFRTVGLVLGWVLLCTPLWLGFHLWHTGQFTMKWGDFRPLEALVSYFFFFLVSCVAMALGGAFITGAKHVGSWSDLGKVLDENKKRTLEDIRRLD